MDDARANCRRGRGWGARLRACCRYGVRLLAAAGVLGATGLGLFAWFGPRLCPFPDGELSARRPARVFTAADGSVIGAEIGDRDQWRLPVPLARISPYLVQATLAAEDRRFWHHGGIDWLAAARAAWQNVRHGRVVSGASTITMQVCRLTCPEPRGWPAKVRQVCRALDLERRHSKAWILEQYFGLAPYGGNRVGAEAAALAYFGRSARDLTLSEAVLLAGLPQRPSALRPDRHPQAAQARFRRVAEAMGREGWLPPDEVARLTAGPAPALASRAAGTGAANRLGLPVSEPAYCRLASAQVRSGDPMVSTGLDPVAQGAARTALAARLAACPDVDAGAVVVIEVGTGIARAVVSSAAAPRGQDGPAGGGMNAACARRSPGSALKPFLYLMALDDGRIVPDSVLEDAPLPFADYRPANFDGRFREHVTARLALRDSLNAPAVRLLGELGVGYALTRLRECGLRTLDRGAEAYGLALALGGGEVTLLDLTSAYAGLARGGRFAGARFLAVAGDDPAAAAPSPFAPGSVSLVTGMLRGRPLPGCPTLDLAWKTGTSAGFRDAWCVACNPQFVVGVWLGNASGRPSRALVGLDAAAPVAGAVMAALYDGGRQVPEWPPPIGVCEERVCGQTGLRAGGQCPTQRLAQGVSGVPLRACPAAAHRPATGPSPGLASLPVARPDAFRITAPVAGTYRAAEPGSVRLALTAGEDECAWFVDGCFLGRSRQPLWHEFGSGRHLVVGVSTAGVAQDQVEIRVR